VHYCVVGDVKADFFGHYGVNEAFHFTPLAVSAKYQRQGLAKKIFDLTVNMLRQIAQDKASPTYIKGEASSNYTTKIYTQQGFEELFVNPFDSYKIDGQIVIKNTGEHKSMDFYGLKIA